MNITRRLALSLLTAGLAGLATGASAMERVPYDAEAFAAALAAGRPVVIDISASWCPTCQAQKRVLSGLSQKPKFAEFLIFEVDYDTQKDIMRSFKASSRSTLIVFKKGAETGRVVGVTRPVLIEALLDQGA
jgi:thiol-disulfide isomerase/thioredoxin